MVRFDAYTATLKGPKPDDLMGILFDQVGLGATFYASKVSTHLGNVLPSRIQAGMRLALSNMADIRAIV